MGSLNRLDPDADGPPDFHAIAREQATQAFHLTQLDTSLCPRVPWDDLHEVTGPLLPWQWWVLAAHTAMGKSTALMALVQQWIEQKLPVYMLPLEQSSDVMRLYLAALRCGYDPSLVVAQQWDALEADAKTRVINDLRWQVKGGADLIHFSDEATVGERELTAAMMQAAALGAKVFIIDHLHQLEFDGYDAFKRICKLLNEMAKAFRIPILSSAQLNKGLKIDRITIHQPPELTGIQGGYVVGQTCHVALGAFRPFSKRLSRPDEAAIRKGAEIRDFLEPNCVAFNVLKHRLRGQQIGRIVKLRYEQGQISDAPWVQKERWRMATVKEA